MTTRNDGRRMARRHGIARDYLVRIQEHVTQAVSMHTLWGHGGIADPGKAAHLIARPLDEAARLAGNGLKLLESFATNLAGWRADHFVASIADVRRLMVRDDLSQPRGEELSDAVRQYFRDSIVHLTIALPTEEAMPELVLDPHRGLRLAESRACPVKLQGTEGDSLRAIVKGQEIDPPFTPRMYRLLTRLIEAGEAGLTKEQLGNDRPAVSELLRAHNGWREVIESPGRRGSRNRPGIYRIEAA